MENTERRRAAYEWVTIGTLLAFLALPPVIATLQGWPGAIDEERREAAQWPGLERGSSWPADVDRFLEDRIGLRTWLIQLNSLASVRLFRTSPSERVTVGRDGWFYYDGAPRTAANDRVSQHARGARVLSSRELESFARRRAELARGLEALGVHYVFSVAPNKHAIYPEYLPAAFNRVRSYTPHDQVVTRLAELGGVEFVDLRPALLAAKTRARVYAKTDTHWNAIGAFVAYQSLLDGLSRRFPELAPRALDAFDVEWRDGEGGGLARMLGLTDVLRERTPYLTPHQGYRAKRVSAEALYAELGLESDSPLVQKLSKTQMIVTEQSDPSLRSAIVLFDSFGIRQIDWIGEHFRRVVFLHRYTPLPVTLELAELIQPDVLVEEMVERALVPTTFDR